MWALFDSDSEVNTIHPGFIKELRLFIRLIDIKAQKNNDTILDIYGMVIADFLVIDKAN